MLCLSSRGLSPYVFLIRQAYRKLAIKYHPDKNPGNKEAPRDTKGMSHLHARVGDLNLSKKPTGGFLVSEPARCEHRRHFLHKQEKGAVRVSFQGL